jgi:hypothetical protein
LNASSMDLISSLLKLFGDEWIRGRILKLSKIIHLLINISGDKNEMGCLDY